MRSELEDVRTHLREELPTFFEFDVVVGNISYNANNNTVTATVEPASEARTQLSEELGGVNVRVDGSFEFEFGFSAE